MIRVKTGARLHFGLFSLPPTEPWPEFLPGTRVPARYYGGIGAMIDEPGFDVAFVPEKEWSVCGEEVERTRFFVDRLREQFPDLLPHHVHVYAAPPAHAGFGAGTQLGLAIGEALLLRGNERLPTEKVAVLTGRGARSAVGVFGFAWGGFWLDVGKARDEPLGKSATSSQLPATWRFVVATPATGTKWSGERERQALDQLAAGPAGSTGGLYQLAIEALAYLGHKDVRSFGAVLTEINARVGDWFAPVQGGRFASPQTAALVQELQRSGAAGAGQTSWGPTAWGLYEDRLLANRVAKTINTLFPGVNARAVKPLNRGATITVTRSPSAAPA